MKFLFSIFINAIIVLRTRMKLIIFLKYCEENQLFCIFLINKYSSQHQLGCTVSLTVWHLTQIKFVSLHLSMQQGSQHNTRVVQNKKHPQVMATQPTFFLVICVVKVPQYLHGVPLILLSFSRLIGSS